VALRQFLARSAAARVGGLPSAFWWQLAGTLINRAGTFVQPFLVLYLTTERGMSPAGAGAVLTAYGAGAFASQLLGGMLTDRIGRRPTLVGGTFASAGALLLLGAAREPLLLAAAAVLVGVCGDLYRPASAALVADLVPPEDRPRAYALLFWAVNVGFSVATVSAGALASHGYALFFLADAGSFVVFGVLVWRGTRGLPSRPAGAGPALPGGLRVVLGDRLLLVTTAVMLAYAIVYMQAYLTLPLAVRDAGLPPSSYGLALAVNGIAIVLIQPLVLPLLGRLPQSPLLAGSHLVVGAGMALTGLCSSTPAFAASVFVWTLGEIGAAGSMSALVAAIAPAHLRGRYLGMMGAAFGGAALTAPLIGTAVYAGPGPGWLWAGCAATGLAALLVQSALTPAYARRAVIAADRARVVAAS
jgi:predicted MFS family arabinose efflux permease